MAAIPQAVRDAFGDQGSAPVFTTGDPSGLPNAIYATCIRIFDDETFVIADNYFNKTKENLLSGSKGTILFITSEKKAYQVKGMIEYVSEGEYFDFMKS